MKPIDHEEFENPNYGFFSKSFVRRLLEKHTNDDNQWGFMNFFYAWSFVLALKDPKRLHEQTPLRNKIIKMYLTSRHDTQVNSLMEMAITKDMRVVQEFLAEILEERPQIDLDDTTIKKKIVGAIASEVN